MKTNRIDKHLRGKFADWLSSIKDEELRSELSKSAFFAGGCITSLLLDEKVNDYDIYISNVHTASDLAQYYIKIFKETSSVLQKDTGEKKKFGVIIEDDRVKITVESVGMAAVGEENAYQFFEMLEEGKAAEYVDRVFDLVEDTKEGLVKDAEDKYRPIFVTSNAITLSDNIQVIFRFTGKPAAIFRNFDFVHCCNCWTNEHGLRLLKDAVISIITKELRYSGSKYPLCSLFRIRKFIKRGWTITAGQILKIALQVSDLDLEDVDTLEDQLIGVDMAYFAEVIQILRKENKKNIDRAYLLQVVEQVFEED